MTDALQYNLEFELRLQQYIEMIRTGDKKKLLEAMVHAKKYLTPYMETQSTEISHAAGLLAFPRDTKAEPYRVCVEPLVVGSHRANHVAGNVLFSSMDSSRRTLCPYPP